MAITCLTGGLLVFIDSPVLFKMHRWLLDVPQARGAMTTGKLIVGVSTLAFVIVLISGLIMWFKRAPYKPHTPVRHKVLDRVHITAGGFITVFLLIMALTGLSWSFGWYRDVFYAMAGQDNRMIVKELHTGSIGGIVTQIIWCVSALWGFVLAVTGYWMFARRRRAIKRARAQR